MEKKNELYELIWPYGIAGIKKATGLGATTIRSVIAGKSFNLVAMKGVIDLLKDLRLKTTWDERKRLLDGHIIKFSDILKVQTKIQRIARQKAERKAAKKRNKILNKKK